MSEEKLYTFGREEALEIADPKYVKTVEKGSFSLKYVDIPRAINIMRTWRGKKGLGNKVEISLKKEVRLRKTANYQKVFRTTICPFTQLTYGKFRGINPNNQSPQWSTVELNEFRSFNLDNDDDAADWLILRLATCIEGSATSMKYFETKYWEFHDLRANNANVITKANDIVKIVRIIEGMSGYEMVNFARLLNMIVDPGDEQTLQLVDIQGHLMGIAMDNPDEFLSKYKDGNRQLQELLTAGEAVGVVQFSHTDGYTVLGNRVGLTKEEAISYLRSEKNLFALVKEDVIGNDILAKRMEEQKPEANTRKMAIQDSLSKTKALTDEEILV
jgi:hypothetical protein